MKPNGSESFASNMPHVGNGENGLDVGLQYPETLPLKHPILLSAPKATEITQKVFKMCLFLRAL